MFEKLGVDDIDLKIAIKKHELLEDPIFNKITQDFMVKMQAQMKQHMSKIFNQ